MSAHHVKRIISTAYLSLRNVVARSQVPQTGHTGSTSSGDAASMLLVTGGAGFIGSNVVASLNEAGRTDIAVNDILSTGQKWRNLVGRRLAECEPAGDLVRAGTRRSSQKGDLFLLPGGEDFGKGAVPWRTLLQCQKSAAAIGVDDWNVQPLLFLEQSDIALHVGIDSRKFDRKNTFHCLDG